MSLILLNFAFALEEPKHNMSKEYLEKIKKDKAGKMVFSLSCDEVSIEHVGYFLEVPLFENTCPDADNMECLEWLVIKKKRSLGEKVCEVKYSFKIQKNTYKR